MKSSDALTAPQRETLDYIERYIKSRSLAPSTQEIGDAMGLKSIHAVQARLLQLERKGWISREPGRPRSIQLTRGNLAHIIRGARVSGSYTQADLAKMAGVTASYISKIENEAFNLFPSKAVLEAIAGALKLDPEILLRASNKSEGVHLSAEAYELVRLLQGKDSIEDLLLEALSALLERRLSSDEDPWIQNFGFTDVRLEDSYE